MGDRLQSRTPDTQFSQSGFNASPVVLAAKKLDGRYLAQTAIVFFAYFVAGRLGQATENIRSSNLGPVWPAYGIALAAFLLLGNRAWLGVGTAAFLVAWLSPVPVITAFGQAAGSTLAALVGAFLLSRFANFDPSLTRLRDALSLLLIGALGSAIVSASIGMSVLYATHQHAYSGIGSAWLIYWLGDAMGVMLVTPLVLTFPALVRIRGPFRFLELASLLILLAIICVIVFGRLPMVPAEVHVLALTVLPFVMWSAIRFGVSGAALSVLVVAAVATIETALGSGPFVVNDSFTNGILLDVFFGVLSITGLSLAVLRSEQELAQREREQIVRKQAAIEAHLQGQKVLQESEERLRLAIQAGKMYAYDWNPATDVVVRSALAKNILGSFVEGPSVPRRELLDRIHADDRALFEASVNERTPDSPDMQTTYRLVRPNGSVVWLEKTMRAFFDEQGKLVRTMGMVADVTQRKRAEEALSESEEKFRNVFLEAGVGMVIVSLEGRFLAANKTFCDYLGYTEAELLQKTVESVTVPEDWPSFSKKLGEAITEGRGFQQAHKRCLHKSGRIVHTESSTSVVRNRNGEFQYFIGEVLDITQRKEAEEALSETNRALEKQAVELQTREELLRLFVKNVPAAVAMLDRDMRYLQVSDRWCAAYLPGQVDILGRSHYEIFPDMPERWKEIHRRALGGETLRADEDRWEGKDGTHWARWEVRPWKTTEGAVGGILILAEDIGRRKQLEESLSVMSRKLIESQEQERARIGRELHDDITQRLAMLAIDLAQVQDNPSEVQSRVQKIQARIIQISEDVQALSHELHSAKLEYLGVVAGIKSWCREFAERQTIEIDFKDDVSSALPYEVGLSLLRVLQEALHNAIKHSGVKRIEVQLAERPNEVHLVVSDSGKGFDLDKAKQSAGLGLISMRERIRLVNGEIAIHSKPMAGTTIYARVPIRSEHALGGREREKVN